MMAKISDLDAFFEDKKESIKLNKEKENSSREKIAKDVKDRLAMFNAVMNWSKENVYSCLKKKADDTNDSLTWESLEDEIAKYKEQSYHFGKAPYRDGGYFKITYKPKNHAALIINFDYYGLHVSCESGIDRLGGKDSFNEKISLNDFTNEYVENLVTQSLKGFLKIKE